MGLQPFCRGHTGRARQWLGVPHQDGWGHCHSSRPGPQCSTQSSAPGNAPDVHLRSRTRTVTSRRNLSENRHSDLLCRSAQPLAASDQREYQRAIVPIHAQGNRPVRVEPGQLECHRLPAQHPASKAAWFQGTAGSFYGSDQTHPERPSRGSLTECCT